MTVNGASQQYLFVGPDNDPDKYRILCQVARGAEANIWKAEVALAGQWEPVALKTLRPHWAAQFEAFASHWADQAELLRFIRHPGVVGVREHFIAPDMHRSGEYSGTADRLYLVMNWIDGIDLSRWMVLNPPPGNALERLRLLQNLAEAVDFLHSGLATPSGREVIHGDISPGNVVLTPSGQVVLVDFGLLHIASRTSDNASGTRGFVAPEVLERGIYSPASDRYSFGAVAYYLLTGQLPPRSLDEIKTALLGLPLPPHSEEAFDLAWRIFSMEPCCRPSASEWAAAMMRSPLSSTISPHESTSSRQPLLLPASVRPRRARARNIVPPTAAALLAVAGASIGVYFSSANNHGPQTRHSRDGISVTTSITTPRVGTSPRPVVTTSPPPVATTGRLHEGTISRSPAAEPKRLQWDHLQ